MPISRLALTHAPSLTAPLKHRAVARAVLAWAISSLCAGAAWSQSLPELYDAARAYDAAYLAAKAQAESAKFRAAQSDSLALPNVALNSSGTQTESNSPRPPSGSNRTDGLTNLQANVRARQPLYNRANKATIEQAQRSLELASADLETAEQDLKIGRAHV